MGRIIESLIISLLLTLAFETVFLLICRKGRDLGLLLLVNMVTNPAAVLLHRLLGTAAVPFIELAVVLVEWRYYKSYAREIKRPLLFSLGANIFSFTIGLLLNRIF